MVIETQIISHLTGTLTPAMLNELQGPTMLYAAAGLFTLIAILGCIIWFFSAIVNSFKTPESKAYRSLIADMYVIGMVKKFAEDDGIDLIKELKAFSKMQKKQKFKDKDIDSVIEDNLKDKVNAKAEKDIEKIEED